MIVVRVADRHRVGMVGGTGIADGSVEWVGHEGEAVVQRDGKAGVAVETKLHI